MVKKWDKDNLKIQQFANRKLLGEAAGYDFATAVATLLQQKETINVVFAAAPSQNEFLATIANDPSIDFTRIHAYHMDEYVGLPKGSDQTFGTYLSQHIFSLRTFATVNYMDSQAASPALECGRYAGLINSKGIDIVCMGIGENGHIAFNDPPVADFSDPFTVKLVTLEEACRYQQVHDGCFSRLEDVPIQAITLTIPALSLGAYHFCMVPARTKAEAVRSTLTNEISTQCPATILRTWQNTTLYIDSDSASLL
jgi:glucosamine-6-phosphate deaminase